MVDSQPPVRWWQRRTTPWAIAGAAVALAIPLAVFMRFAAPRAGDGVNCNAIGFGEPSCGWDAIGGTFLLLGVPYVLAGAAVLGLLELVPGRGAQAVRLVAATLFLVTPWCFMALLLLMA